MNDLSVLPQLLHHAQTYDAFFNTSSCNFSALSLNGLEGLIPPELSPNAKSCRRVSHALLAVTLRHFQVLNTFDSVHSCSSSLSRLTQVRNPEALLCLRTPCTAPVPNCTSVEMRTNATYLNSLSTHSL
jgi:hypothetical protein